MHHIDNDGCSCQMQNLRVLLWVLKITYQGGKSSHGHKLLFTNVARHQHSGLEACGYRQSHVPAQLLRRKRITANEAFASTS